MAGQRGYRVNGARISVRSTLDKGTLHIEAPGCIINITPRMTNTEGQPVTSIEVIPDRDRFGEKWEMASIFPRSGVNVRVIQTKKEDSDV